MTIKLEDLDNWFAYRPPADEEQVTAYVYIREAGKVFAKHVLARTPPGPDQTTAIRTIREAVMWANAALACASRSAPAATED